MSALTIFEQLRRAGMSVAGALGTMGSMQEESGLEACRVQGDFSPDRYLSRDYANKVDNGLMSEDSFAKDGKGWGLVQFTWPGYKRGLLTFCRRHSISIANETAQIDYLVAVLKQEFASLWSFLCTCNDDQLYTATDRFCREFERPAVNNVNARFQAAKRLRDEIQSKATESIDNSVATDKVGKYWPPRGSKGGKDDPGLCNGMNGADVTALQGLLLAHGYTYGNTLGVFGDSTERAVRKFQQDNGLAVDGIAGPNTWAAITKI